MSAPVCKRVQSAYKKKVQSYLIHNENGIKDPETFLNWCKHAVEELVVNLLSKSVSIKCNVELGLDFIIKKGNAEILGDIVHLISRMKIMNQSESTSEWYENDVKEYLLLRIEEYSQGESGKSLNNVYSLKINAYRFDALNGGFYIELPDEVKNKGAVINFQKSDGKCFFYSVMAGLFPLSVEDRKKKNSNRVNSYPRYQDHLTVTGISTPVKLSDISAFEKINDISVNVYTLNKANKVVGPTHFTKNKKDRHVNLLFLQKGEKGHYCCITNMSRLISNQTSRHGHRIIVCERCLQIFNSTHKFETHTVDCMKNRPCKIIMPKNEKRFLKFKNHIRKERLEFVVYADIETLCVPIASCPPDFEKPYRELKQVHIPFSIAYQVVCSYNENMCAFDLIRSDDCVEYFYVCLKNLKTTIEKLLDNPVPLKMSKADEISFQSNNVCHICGNVITEDEIKCRDHNHLSQVYRGPAHLSCNLQFSEKKLLVVYFHNLGGFDSHFLLKTFSKIVNEDNARIRAVSANTEKIISFSIFFRNPFFEIRFVDSYKFLSESLDNLISLTKPEDLKWTKKMFPDARKFALMSKKGVMCYSYLTSFSVLEDRELPSIDKFYNELTETHITEEEYERARDIWQEFKIETLGDFCDEYLKTDCCLLTDVMENFRSLSLDTYELDPAYYITLPSLSWDSMLKMTKVELELLDDYDQILFWEKAKRGGLSQASVRRLQANNRYLPNYDPTLPEVFIMLFDINALYANTMLKENLPVKSFRWLSSSEVNKFDIENSPDNFLLEVDLSIPLIKHDYFRDLPLAPEHLVPLTSDINITKLMATFYDKKKYVVHVKTLKLYVELGVKITKFHRILTFETSNFFSEFVRINAAKRAAASNDFHKALYKLIVNANFGKSIEDIRKRRDIRFTTQWKGNRGARKLIAHPNFQKLKVFSENFAMVEMQKSSILFDKPIYLGMSILDLSKCHMYDLYYNKIKNVFKENVSCAYVDTDSYMLKFVNSDPYLFMKENPSLFDTSDYPEKNRYGIIRANTKLVGVLKDESKGVCIVDYCALKSKMYAYKVENESEIKKMKGVKRAVLRNLDINDYINALHSKNDRPIYRQQHMIKSIDHVVFTIVENKSTLSKKDDKRFVEENGVTTLPWGHWRLWGIEKEIKKNKLEK